MPYEIDYIPVGEGDKAGAAITLRYGNLNGRPEKQTVVVVDGTFTDCGGTDILSQVAHDTGMGVMGLHPFITVTEEYYIQPCRSLIPTI
jgi:hypothetical protein